MMIKKIGNTNIQDLEGVNPFDLGDVVTNDGVNHPADRNQ